MRLELCFILLSLDLRLYCCTAGIGHPTVGFVYFSITRNIVNFRDVQITDELRQLPYLPLQQKSESFPDDDSWSSQVSFPGNEAAGF
jgi:hypothetical protein